MESLKELLAVDHRQALEFSFWACWTSQNHPLIAANCCATPACLRTTPRCPLTRTVSSRLLPILVRSPTILCSIRPFGTTVR